jgi:MFS family permease
MGVLLFFRLVTGLCGAGFLSVAGGTVSDMFRPGTTDLPTAVYTLAPLSGPCLGPILGGYMNQNVTWRATFYLIIGWGAVEFVLLWLLVPETFLPIVQKREARRLRAATGEGAWTAPTSGRTVRDVFPAALWVPLKLMAVEKMALAMDTWTALILGIIYLFFNAIPYTFRTLYNLYAGVGLG